MFLLPRDPFQPVPVTPFSAPAPVALLLHTSRSPPRVLVGGADGVPCEAQLLDVNDSFGLPQLVVPTPVSSGDLDTTCTLTVRVS